MKLEFKHKYKSISGINVNTDDLPDFSLIVGKNGSGKSHLLQAIKNGSILVSGYNLDTIQLFNFEDFLIKNQTNISKSVIAAQRKSAWQSIKQNQSFFNRIDHQIKSIYDGENPYSLNIEDNHNYQNIVSSLRDHLVKISSNDYIKKGLLFTGIFHGGKFITEMTEDNFFMSSTFDGFEYSLMTNLSQIFLEYATELEIKKNDFEKNNISKDEYDLFESNAPWVFINDMFASFHLTHRVTYPLFIIDDYIRRGHELSFQVKLKINDEEIDFESLSSGERILCALAVTMYQNTKITFPRLLLLDEIDAFLHPSMIQSLFDVINNIFLERGCKVILTSHSPTTASLSNGDNIFEISSDKEKKSLNLKSQAESVDILSEGFMTLDKGLKIFDQIFQNDLTIISEGTNWRHVKRAVELLEPNLLHNIQFYEHDVGSGVADLAGLFEFIKKTKVARKVLFIRDCDAHAKIIKKHETEKVFKFCFQKNELNTIAFKGIENLYSDDFFTDDIITQKTQKVGHNPSSTTKTFENSNKKDFLNKVQSSMDSNIFSNFQPLIQKIDDILNS